VITRSVPFRVAHRGSGVRRRGVVRCIPDCTPSASMRAARPHDYDRLASSRVVVARAHIDAAPSTSPEAFTSTTRELNSEVAGQCTA